MAHEVQNPMAYPYRAVVMIVVTYPDGSEAYGTGALVGPNDVLTATHVLYSPDNGGQAVDISLYPGADFNGQRGDFDDIGVKPLEYFHWEAIAWPSEVFVDHTNHYLTSYESQYDVALLGIDEAIGYELGWFGLATGYNHATWAHQIGYPSSGTGMMAGEIYVSPHSQYWIYQAEGWGVGTHMGAGSSGGPLYVEEADGPYIIGVKSAGSTFNSVWADVDFVYDELQAAIAANDYLFAHELPPEPEPQPEPIPWPVPVEHAHIYNQIFFSSSTAGNMVGSPALDLMVYESSRHDFHISRELDHIAVSFVGSTATDRLYDVERVQFSEGILALDTDYLDAAGSAYRLYQAAFDREPDLGGLNYWILQMDMGSSLQDVATSFVSSAEFQDLYGAQPSAEALVNQYYLHVLARAPDTEGFNYWVDQLNSPNGLTPAEVLASISESAENMARVAPAINDGIWLG